jgi:hypothetical protein
VFTPIPPQSNEPPPEPRDGPGEIEAPDDEPDADEPPDLDLPLLHGPARWPAVVRWSRLCRVLAFVGLVCFGWAAASNLYEALYGEPQFAFMQPRATPGWYFFYAFLYSVFAVASCLSLLGFAELLHLLMSIEATSRQRPDRSPRRDEPGVP